MERKNTKINYSSNELQVKEEKVVIFNEGIPGFENLTKYILLEEENSKFLYLQSLEDENICFVVVDPYVFKEDYAPIISESYFEKLGGGEDSEFVIYAIVCIKKPIGESTLNLAGPLLIHVKNRLGIQVVTEEKTYRTKHTLNELVTERSKNNARTN